MPLVRLLLGIVFVLVGIVWARRAYSAYHKNQRRGRVAMAFDFASGSSLDVVLIFALLFFGVLLIAGYWWSR